MHKIWSAMDNCANGKCDNEVLAKLKELEHRKENQYIESWETVGYAQDDAFDSIV